MNSAVFTPPVTIAEYLGRLRKALDGADPALVQDALYDAEEYLRSEMAEQPGRSEAEVIASVAGSYGEPGEVADIYRETEVTVQTALRTPAQPPRKSLPGRFFGVAADPRTYGALFYMVLSLATGIFYFTWVVAGVSISIGMSVLIIGIPLVILYFGSVRVLSLVEGRVVETMLGERMPRRPLYTERGKPLLSRIKDLFTDPRSWTTQLYFLLMLPLGIVYFTGGATLLAISLAFTFAPVLVWLGHDIWINGEPLSAGLLGGLELAAMMVAGVLLLFATLHLVRWVGLLHGHLAKHLLVKTAQYS